jgi:hypothetical protein
MGEFDMIVDVNGNGKYDYGTDALDNNDKGAAGFVIPEFSSFLILPLIMITTLLAVIVYKRRSIGLQSSRIWLVARAPSSAKPHVT